MQRICGNHHVNRIPTTSYNLNIYENVSNKKDCANLICPNKSKSDFVYCIQQQQQQQRNIETKTNISGSIKYSSIHKAGLIGNAILHIESDLISVHRATITRARETE